MMKPDLDNFAVNSFSVWQCKDGTVDDNEIVKSQIQQAFLSRNVKRLHPRQKLRELKLSEEDTLIVEVPSTYPHSFYSMMQFNAVKEPLANVWCLTIKHDMTP